MPKNTTCSVELEQLPEYYMYPPMKQVNTIYCGFIG